MAGDCPNRERNLKDCNCTYTACGKQGMCCECIRYHRSMNQLPACYFDAADERSYDRSIARFVRADS